MTSQHNLLRANIESAMSAPSVILVTSARPGDGKSATAYGLARSLERAGHRVALVDASVVTSLGRHSPPRDDAGSIAFIAMPRETTETKTVRAGLANFVRDVRGTFDYVIVDGTTFHGSATGMQLAGIVDGVLLTVRAGRRESEDDVLMVRTLGQSAARLLGVVAIESREIAFFREERRSAVAPESRPFAFEPKVDDVPVIASLAR